MWDGGSKLGVSRALEWVGLRAEVGEVRWMVGSSLAVFAEGGGADLRL